MRTSGPSGILREVAVNDVDHLGNFGTCLIVGQPPLLWTLSLLLKIKHGLRRCRISTSPGWFCQQLGRANDRQQDNAMTLSQ
jgi:hypothetical protein